ncbi:MAG TPA: helix-turn-helix domain-containing protein [Stellaceae bacterium]|nr:helix-turn-helix domain-containing protein [Stellaceae bacterium]
MTTETITRRLLDSEGAAQYLDCSKALMEKMRTAGNGPRFVKIGASVRYDVRDLDAYIDSRRRTSTSDTGTEAHAA